MHTSSSSIRQRFKHTRTRIALATTMAAGLATVASANTVTVGGDGAAAPTLSVGVSMAANGDTVLVHPGSYYEIVNTSKSIHLVADGSSGSVILDGGSFASVLKFQNVTGDVSIQGFALRNGSSTRGGGLVLDNVSGTCTLTECEFSGNIATTSGGGVDCTNVTAHFTSCVFEQNWVTGPTEQRGGAIAGRGGSTLSFSDCSFRDNDGGYGGAIYCSGAMPTLESCLFTSNDALRGGAVYVSNASSASIEACTFETCTSDEFGGAVFFTGSGYTVQGSTFHANSTSGMGGAIYCAGGSSIEIAQNLFNGNSADDGGAVAGAPSLAEVHNNTFYGNSATGSGAHLFCHKSSPSVYRNIFSDAVAGSAVGANSPAAPTFGCNDFWNNADGDIAGLTDPMGLDGNITEDPLFCDASSDNFGIDTASPCYFDNAPSECSGLGSGDIGAFSGLCGANRVETASWGLIKARYK